MAKTARVHPLVRQRLDDLQTALQKESGISAGPEEVVGALLHGITLGQLASMVQVFVRYTVAYRMGEIAPYQLAPPLLVGPVESADESENDADESEDSERNGQRDETSG
jgi:hypothetical protein